MDLMITLEKEEVFRHYLQSRDPSQKQNQQQRRHLRIAEPPDLDRDLRRHI